MDPKQIDLNQLGKQFCDNCVVGMNNEAFFLIPIAGQQATAYVLTPEHAKRLSQSLTHYVQLYEKNNRPITSNWTEHMPSPIQMTDLPGKDAGSSEKK